MDGRAVPAWCRERPGATAEQRSGAGQLVEHAGGRMFAAVPAARDPATVNLKCEPEFARHLRAEHPAVAPGYHMDKRHWNTVRLDGSLPPALVEELLGHSYTPVLD